MVHCTDPTSQDNEERGDSIANPNADPCLPPTQSDLQRRGSDHPGVDVEAVGDPEGDEVDMSPLSALRLNGFQIMIRQEELSVG